MSFNIQRIAISAGSIATAALTALAFQPQIVKLAETIGIPASKAVSYVNYSLSIILIVLIVITPMLLLLGIALNFFSHPDLVHTFHDASVSVCDEDDLEQIAKMANRQFGPRASDLPTIKRIFHQSPSVYWKVEAKGVCGYFVIYGLTRAGESAIKEGHFYGASPNPVQITKDIRKAKAVCASAVVGFGLKGRAGALSGLTSVINAMKFQRVYAKPIANDGLRMIKKYGFRRVDDGSQTYELDHYYVLDAKSSSSVSGKLTTSASGLS